MDDLLEEHHLWLEDKGGKQLVLIDVKVAPWIDLIGRYMQASVLRGADLRGANLCGTDLSDTDLRGADLRGADLWGANITDTKLDGADLRGANLKGVHWFDEFTTLHKAALTGAIFLPGWKIVRIRKRNPVAP
jgi:uncharacterized protein YjbI with pentapeptide repeats